MNSASRRKAKEAIESLSFLLSDRTSRATYGMSWQMDWTVATAKDHVRKRRGDLHLETCAPVRLQRRMRAPKRAPVFARAAELGEVARHPRHLAVKSSVGRDCLAARRVVRRDENDGLKADDGKVVLVVLAPRGEVAGLAADVACEV